MFFQKAKHDINIISMQEIFQTKLFEHLSIATLFEKIFFV